MMTGKFMIKMSRFLSASTHRTLPWLRCGDGIQRKMETSPHCLGADDLEAATEL